MNSERIAKFAREGKVKGKRRVGKPKISWLPTALTRRGLNLVEVAIETANLTGRGCDNDRVEMMVMNYRRYWMLLRLCFAIRDVYLSRVSANADPTPTNYVPEIPTFGVFAGVNPTEVQWKGLILGKPPSWSRYSLYQVSMIMPLYHTFLYKLLLTKYCLNQTSTRNISSSKFICKAISKIFTCLI